MLHEELKTYLDTVECEILRFPDLPGFPHHKHLPDAVIDSARPEIKSVLQEVVEKSGAGNTNS